MPRTKARTSLAYRRAYNSKKGTAGCAAFCWLLFYCYPLAAIVPKTLSPSPSHGMTLKLLGITTIGSKVVKISVYFGVGAAFIVCTALAAQIDIPHQFTSGTPARAAEVNANFAALAEESNAQDTRLTAIESSSRRVSAQMICQTFSGLSPVAPLTFRCVRDSNPAGREDLTYADIVAEGWVGVSIGGDSAFVMIFNRYETT